MSSEWDVLIVITLSFHSMLLLLFLMIQIGKPNQLIRYPMHLYTIYKLFAPLQIQMTIMFKLRSHRAFVKLLLTGINSIDDFGYKTVAYRKLTPSSYMLLHLFHHSLYVCFSLHSCYFSIFVFYLKSFLHLNIVDDYNTHVPQHSHKHHFIYEQQRYSILRNVLLPCSCSCATPFIEIQEEKKQHGNNAHIYTLKLWMIHTQASAI